MSKILVAYFSRAGENYFGGAIKSVAVGNTEICADLIKQAFPDADLFKIEMAAPYADNYRKCVSQVTADMMLHKRPALTALPESIAAYDAIVLGYPNYCGTIPMAVATFLEAFDFTGKKLLPYCTNEGSGMGRNEKDLRKLCPTAVIAPGLAITGSAATNCYGVKGMAVRSKTDGLVHLLKRESMAKGVKVYYNEDGTVSIELHIIVENGVNLMAVCRSIMSEVRYVVSKTTGVEVRSVDVFVDSMRF